MLKPFAAAFANVPGLLAALAALVFHLAGAPSVRAQGAVETLLVAPPDGFKVGWQKRDQRMQMMEFVPARETVEDWTEMVTVQIFFGQRRADPNLALQRFRDAWVSACPGGRGDVADAPVAGAYPVANARMDCPLNPKTGKPETAWIKAIGGNDSFFVVQRAVRAPPSPEIEKTATDFLAGIKLCDPRRADQFC